MTTKLPPGLKLPRPDRESPLRIVISATPSRYTNPETGVSSLKVSYKCSDKKDYVLWLGLDKPGYAHDTALGLVRLFGGKATTVLEALSEFPTWRRVRKIQVEPDGKYHRVVGYVFADENKKPGHKQVQSCIGGGFNEDRFWGERDRKRAKTTVTGNVLEENKE